MNEKIQNARELHAGLHQKCGELSARVSLLIDVAAEGQDTAFFEAMIEQSSNAVAFWTAEIVKRVKK